MEAAKSLNVPLKLIRDTAKDGREAYENKLVLIRPDQFIAWSGDQAPSDAAAMLRTAIGTA